MLHIINHQLLGDSLMVTPALRKLTEQSVEFTVYFQDNGIMQIYHQVNWLKNKVFGQMPEPAPGERVIRTDAGAAMNYAITHQKHYSYGFAQQLGVTIDSAKPDVDWENWKYRKSISTTRWLMRQFFFMNHDLPTLLIFPESSSCSSKSGQLANKMLPWSVWENFYKLNKDKYNIAFITPDDSLQNQTTLKLHHGFTITEVACMLTAVDKVLCVDNGIGHLSNAIDANCYMIGGCVPIPYIWAGEMRKTLNCWGCPHLVQVEMIEKLIEQ